MKARILLFVSILLVIFSCKDSGPHPSDMVGIYDVKARLKEGTIDKKSVKEEIKSAMEKAGADLKTAKDDIKNDFDLSSIDTSTIEGKLEYAAKNFGKLMTETGLELGDITEELGAALGGIAESGIDFSETMLKMVHLQVELQADGDIKAKNSIFNMGLSDARWEIKGKDFVVIKHDSQQTESMKILKRDDSGFSLEKDNLILEFVKKK
ncbi:MAG: hypothetical protein IPK35_13400 [Saprospiraceae bacterium]|jgi:hypothetical protein|nr:hypothetical protein [Saprospiraceae bacterium]